jgi:predicted MFS family arabinose efflux permease
LSFAVGAFLGLVIIFVRHFLPESPRWLMTHGREEEAERIVSEVEQQIQQGTGRPLPPVTAKPLKIRVRHHTPWREIVRHIVVVERKRSFLSLTLMASQAFFYNAIFFTYALLLVRYYQVPAVSAGRYLLPFALGNAAGPFLIGRFFDTVGRRRMIVATYALTGVLLAISGWLFEQGVLTAVTQTIAWTVIFFVASCAASSAYLTASEVFPLEIRAMAISVFYSIGTLVGGVGAPMFFGGLIGSGFRKDVFEGYLFAAALLMIGAAVAAFFGVDAERKSLEEISAPLSAVYDDDLS